MINQKTAKAFRKAAKNIVGNTTRVKAVGPIGGTFVVPQTSFRGVYHSFKKAYILNERLRGTVKERQMEKSVLSAV